MKRKKLEKILISMWFIFSISGFSVCAMEKNNNSSNQIKNMFNGYTNEIIEKNKDSILATNRHNYVRKINYSNYHDDNIFNNMMMSQSNMVKKPNVGNVYNNLNRINYNTNYNYINYNNMNNLQSNFNFTNNSSNINNQSNFNNVFNRNFNIKNLNNKTIFNTCNLNNYINKMTNKNNNVSIEKKIEKFNELIMNYITKRGNLNIETKASVNFNNFVGENLLDDGKNNDSENYKLKKELIELLTQNNLNIDVKSKLLEKNLKEILKNLLNVYVKIRENNIKNDEKNIFNYRKKELLEFLADLVESLEFKIKNDGSCFFDFGHIGKESSKNKIEAVCENDAENKDFYNMKNILINFIYHMSSSINEYLNLSVQ